MIVLKWLFIPFLFVSLLLSCSQDASLTSQNPHSQRLQLLASTDSVPSFSSFLIIDSAGQPVESASILIGTEKDKEFTGNTLLTDKTGIARLPEMWTSPLAVTIYKNGYVTQTHFQKPPQSEVFQIRPLARNLKPLVKGSIENFKPIKNDGWIDFGLVIPSFSREALLNLDLSQMISPELEKLSILGFQFEVPSNIYFPKQFESYGLIPFALEKAFFKIFFDFPGTQSISVNKGKFDFNKVVKKIQNKKSYFEVVNEFQFSAVGVHNINVLENTPSVKLNTPLPLNKSTPLNLPFTFPNRILYGISILQEGDVYSILDIKMKDSTSPQLFYSAQKPSQVLIVNSGIEKVSADVEKISDSISTGLFDGAQVNSAILLDLISRPTLTARGIKSQLPNLKKNIQPDSMYAAISEVKNQTSKSLSLERTEVIWEFFAKSWSSEISLPRIDTPTQSTTQRWDLVYFAKTEGAPHATHMVRNAVNVR